MIIKNTVVAAVCREGTADMLFSLPAVLFVVFCPPVSEFSNLDLIEKFSTETHIFTQSFKTVSAPLSPLSLKKSLS